jgi:hypothetical protein
MIRDPSDGSVREKQEEDPAMPTIFDEITAAILAGKVKPERISEKWEYQRAWNDGIDFAVRQIKQWDEGRGR